MNNTKDSATTAKGFGEGNIDMKLLLIADNPDHAELIIDACEGAFPENFEHEISTQLKTAESKLTSGGFDIALIDLQLPDSSVPETIAFLTTLKTNTPIVVLTSLKDADTGNKLIQDGVQDFLPKEELSAALLQRICSYAIERKKQQVLLEQKTEDQLAFCQSLSHDFKGPARNISQLSGLLKSKLENRIELETDELEILELITQKSDTIHELVEGLYQYLRADVVDSAYEDIDLNAMLLRIKEFVSDSQNDPVAIRFSDLPNIKGNPAQLFLVFQNLVLNALKYNEKTPTISITSQSDAQSTSITFQDNGIGIDAKHFDNIFMPFVSLHPKKRYAGSGLGLSIVKRIIDNHKGTILVESEVGAGSRFTITLPK